MKLLIISSPGGSGHIRVANALIHESRNYPHITATEHINIASFLTPKTNTFLFDQYEYSARHFPLWWKCIYLATDNRIGTYLFRFIALCIRITNRHTLSKFDTRINAMQPDYIICTHPVQRFLLHTKTHSTVCMVFTDYDAHTSWIQNQQDILFVPTKKVMNIAISKGAKSAQCIVSGIPVDPVFFCDKEKEVLQRKYTIDGTKKTILILTGGQGLYDPTQHIQTLGTSTQPLNIIVIAGNNTVLKQKLDSLTLHPKHTYQVLGWTDTMDEYMRIADYIITKPGGITVSECLVLQKPMILVSPIPGQEEANCKILCDIQAAVYAKKPTDILKYINTQWTITTKSPNAGRVILDTLARTIETN